MDLIRELNQEVEYEVRFISKTLEALQEVMHEEYSQDFLVENIINLRADVRRYLLNHHTVSRQLSTTLAQIAVLSDELQKEVAKSTKYKEPTLRSKVEHLLQLASELATKDDSTHPKLVDAIHHIIDKLEGNKEKIETIKIAFDKIIRRLTTNDTTLQVKVMKLASAIIQSNGKEKERKGVINSI